MFRNRLTDEPIFKQHNQKRKKILQRDYREINKLYSTIFNWKTFKTTLNPGKMESGMTSKKEYLIFERLYSEKD